MSQTCHRGFMTGIALVVPITLSTLLVRARSLADFGFRGCGAGMWQSAFALGRFASPVIVPFADKMCDRGLFCLIARPEGANCQAGLSPVAQDRRLRSVLQVPRDVPTGCGMSRVEGQFENG